MITISELTKPANHRMIFTGERDRKVESNNSDTITRMLTYQAYLSNEAREQLAPYPNTRYEYRDGVIITLKSQECQWRHRGYTLEGRIVSATVMYEKNRKRISVRRGRETTCITCGTVGACNVWVFADAGGMKSYKCSRCHEFITMCVNVTSGNRTITCYHEPDYLPFVYVGFAFKTAQWPMIITFIETPVLTHLKCSRACNDEAAIKYHHMLVYRSWLCSIVTFALVLDVRYVIVDLALGTR